MVYISYIINIFFINLMSHILQLFFLLQILILVCHQELLLMVEFQAISSISGLYTYAFSLQLFYRYTCIAKLPVFSFQLFYMYSCIAKGVKTFRYTLWALENLIFSVSRKSSSQLKIFWYKVENIASLGKWLPSSIIPADIIWHLK